MNNKKYNLIFLLFIIIVVFFTTSCKKKTCNHNLIKIEAKEATCIDDGNGEYYVCSKCNKIYSDINATNELSQTPTIQALGHTLTKVDAKSATCTQDGNSEYYVCSRCNKIFSDIGTNNELSNIPIIPATGHSFTDSYYYDETFHYKECICHDEVEVHKEEHTFINNECSVCHYKNNKPNLLSMEYIEKKIDKEPFVLSNISNTIISAQPINGIVNIDNNGTYDLTDLTIDSVIINSQSAKLILNNTTINGSIRFLQELQLFIQGESQINSNSFAISGNGNLYINGNKELNISSKDDTSAIICANIVLENLDIVIDSDANGIQGDIVYLKNSKYICTSKGDCINASKNVIIKNSICEFTTNSIFVANNTENREKYNLTDDDFIYNARGEVYGMKPGAYTDYAIVSSAKGINNIGNKDYFNNTDFEKNTYGILIEASRISIDSTCDCMFSTFGFLDIKDSNLHLKAKTNTLRADTIINTLNSTITVDYCYEAIEAPQIQLLSSTINIHSNDDSIESSTRYSKVGNIIVDGGSITTKSDNDDGFDAVNYAYVISGIIKSNGSPTDGEGFDCDKGAIIDGGNILAVSHHTYTDYKEISNQCIIYLNYYPTILDSNLTISILNDNNEVLLTYTINSSFGNVVISSNKLAIGNSYKLLISNGDEYNFEINSTVTKIVA